MSEVVYSFEVSAETLDDLIGAAFTRARAFFTRSELTIEDFDTFYVTEVRTVAGDLISYRADIRVRQAARSPEPGMKFA